jgi:hypothetical protein
MGFEDGPENLNNIEGLDFSKAQLADYARAYKEGRQVEFEAFSPYAMDYNLATGEIDEDNLRNSDKVGLEITRVLREKFPEARMISLYDEYNTGMPDSANYRGRPREEMTDEKGRVVHEKNAPQLRIDQENRENFRASVQQVLENQGIIDTSQDQEGQDYLLVSETEKIKDAEELVRQLEEQAPELIVREGEALYFVKDDGDRVTLRNTNGDWKCEALDASSYIKPENAEITHLVVLPKDFEEQQNNVWAILKSLGIEPTNYHNIFFPENADPDQVARVIKEQIDKHL